MGRHPKPPGDRVRRNADQKGWVQPGPRVESAPPLPERFRGEPEVQRWWDRVWSSEVAGAYLDVDVSALERGAMLVSEISSGEFPASYLGELRQIEDRFGLTPAGRQRLMWMALRDGDAEDEPDAAPVVDIRDRLKRVS